MTLEQFLSDEANSNYARELTESIKLALDIDGTVEIIDCIESEYKGTTLSGLFFKVFDSQKGLAFFAWYHPKK